MAAVGEFVHQWGSLIATLGLIGVTVWYAIQTQSMAKSAQESARSAREAAEYSARSVAVAASGTEVHFYVGPVFAIEDRNDEPGDWFSGVRIECAGAAVFVHRVVVEEAFAPDPDLFDLEPSLSTVEIFANGAIPRLVGLDPVPMLMHKGEFAFLEFAADQWCESEVVTLTVAIDYSFDGKQPLRSRRLEWIGQLGRDFGPYASNASDEAS